LSIFFISKFIAHVPYSFVGIKFIFPPFEIPDSDKEIKYRSKNNIYQMPDEREDVEYEYDNIFHGD
jgi:hypothetical protein